MVQKADYIVVGSGMNSLVMDYQGADHARLYPSRLEQIAAIHAGYFAVTKEAARNLALWMSYEDTIRVADPKVRATRFQRVRKEVQTKDA